MIIIDRMGHAARELANAVANAVDVFGYQVRDALRAEVEKLGTAPTPEQASALLRRFYPAYEWFDPVCDECGDEHDLVVRFGSDPPEYNSPTIDLCRECLSRAVTAAQSPPPVA